MLIHYTLYYDLGMNDGVNRPMTGIRGAGYPGTAAGSGSANRRGVFDPLNQAVKSAGSGGSPAGLDNSRRDETPEDKIKSLEKKGNKITYQLITSKPSS